MKTNGPTKTKQAVPWLRIFFVTVLLAVSILAGVGTFLAARAATANFPGPGGSAGQTGPEIVAGGSRTPPPGQAAPPTGELEGEPLPEMQNPAAASAAPSLTPWDGASRVTILLLGLDYRDWSSGNDASRSDTMILLTLDPLTKTAGILSVPRDMWVPIPGFSHAKINTAYYLGQAYKLPGGGPALAVKTVEQFLGVPINYYAQIDFGAFVRFIDELGGVTVDVPEKITIDLLGSGSKTKKTLQPGRQTLPGEWALAYARARHTEGGDFDRAARQQQVILGIRDRVVRLNMLPTLIAKAPTLYNELAAGIHTNLNLDQAIKLALLAQTVPDEAIKRGVLGKGYVEFGWSPDNLSILVPLPDKIHILRDEIFASSSAIGPEVPGTAQDQFRAEAARLAVLDGSGAGLAQRTADWLAGVGGSVAQVGEADQAYSATTLIDHTGNPYALKYLVEVMKVNPLRVLSQYDPASAVDVEVILGRDWAQGNPMP